jgi:mono/diheme cytochrome c family protein
MAKALRWAGYVVAVFVILVLLAAGWIWFASSRVLAARVEPQQERLVQPTAAQLADGPRQLRVLGCISCHGENLEGEPFITDRKIALLDAPNLTLLASEATDQQLAQAIRQGIGHDGRSLLVMPAESYQFLTDQEVAALIAAVRSVPKNGSKRPALRVGPIGRFALATGRFPTIPKLAEHYRSSRIADFGPEHALGRHLVETNCSGCHGPDLKGKELEPGTVSADLAITGAYDLDQFRTLLRTGAAPGGKKLGLMARISQKDLRYMRDDEIAAIHGYLVERARRAP